MNQLSIFLREFSLAPGTRHIMVAEAWTPGSEVASTNYTFDVNQVPSNGTCTVTPDTGE